MKLLDLCGLLPDGRGASQRSGGAAALSVQHVRALWLASKQRARPPRAQEVNAAAQAIYDMADADANIIFGAQVGAPGSASAVEKDPAERPPDK